MGYLIALIILGLIFVLVEIFLTPGIGVAGVIGILFMGGSSYYAFYEFGDTSGYVVTGLNIALLLVLVVVTFKTKAWEKVSLKTNIDAKALNDDASQVRKGDVGRSMTRLAPMGTAKFGEFCTEVKALEGMIDPGVDVQIVLIEDNKIYVSPVYPNTNS